MTADQVGERRGTFRPRVNWAFQRIRPRMREPLKIIKTPALGELPGRGMAHGKQALAGNASPLTPGLLALTMTAIPYLAAELSPQEL